MAEKKAVVFDFGGVMTATTEPVLVREALQELGIGWEVAQRGYARYRHAYDAGDIALAELYERTWRDGGVTLSEADFRRVLECDRASWLRRNPRTLDWMRALKAEGRRIGILTNMAPDFAPLFLEHYAEYVELADAMVISGLVRMHKPQPQIYALLRERIGLEASRLVFVDDVEENCEAARRAGWNAIRFSSNEQVERDLAALER